MAKKSNRGEKHMHDFTPPPHYSSQWWRTEADKDHSCFQHPLYELDQGPSLVSSHTFIVHSYLSHGPGLDDFSALFFPTATDCLLWFRWAVMTYVDYGDDEHDEGTDPGYADLAKIIDEAEPGTNAVNLLQSLKERLALPAPFELHGIESIHEFLSDAGNTEAWRRALQCDDVNCVDGRWELSPEAWALLYDVLEPYRAGEVNRFDLATIYIDEENAVFDQLGGGEVVSRRDKVFRLMDGRVVKMLCPLPGNPEPDYLYRFDQPAVQLTERTGCTHVGFILGEEGFAVVPIEVVKRYIAERTTNQSRQGLAGQAEYEVAIAPAPHVALKGCDGVSDLDISGFYCERDYS